MLHATGRFTPPNSHGLQVSPLSSVQLSPNRVRSDFDLGAVDLFHLFTTSPRADGDMPYLSPISSPVAGCLPDEVAGSRDGAIGSPATSLSITDHTVDLQLMTPPLIPFPDTILVQADSALRHIRILPQSTRRRLCPGRGRLTL